jgi:hypothetical protein
MQVRGLTYNRHLENFEKISVKNSDIFITEYFYSGIFPDPYGVEYSRIVMVAISREFLSHTVVAVVGKFSVDSAPEVLWNTFLKKDSMC